jgi:putative transcriptional regulator
MGDVKSIGNSVRVARKAAGLTQSVLANLAGVSERTVRAIATGTGNPTLGAVVRVANALGLRVVATQWQPTYCCGLLRREAHEKRPQGKLHRVIAAIAACGRLA